MSKVFPRCEIVPTTKRLKEIIKEYGTEWALIEPIRKVQCFDNEVGAHVRSSCGKHNRWVRYPEQIRFT